MNTEQFEHLLRDLANVAGLADPERLIQHACVRVGGIHFVLEHLAASEPDVVCLRMHLGAVDPQDRASMATALLETNFVFGWGGRHVFSMVPGTGQVVLTLRRAIADAMTAQELWQALSDAAEQGRKLWKDVLGTAHAMRFAGEVAV